VSSWVISFSCSWLSVMVVSCILFSFFVVVTVLIHLWTY
jgi:hypothetical protein